MVDVAELLADLAAESDELDAMVGPLSDVDWARPTPSPGWTIAHQIAHLAWTDRAALLAATDQSAFSDLVAKAAQDGDFAGAVDRGAAEFMAPPPELLARWREGRVALAAALAAVPPTERMPWFAVPMTPTWMVTGRIMETWAHGLDVAEALGIDRPPSPRMRHVAMLGARAIAMGFIARGMDPPSDPVRIELSTPDGGQWTYGPADAPDRVVGPMLDFCLLVTQRRHRSDLALAATGPTADAWLDVAQAFAGPPGAGREPSPAGG